MTAPGAKSQRELFDEVTAFIKPEEIPAKLRCATCSQLVLNAFRLPCCDQSICESCSQNLPETCPVCTHSPLDRSLLNPHKSLRMTVTAFLRAEHKKRIPKAISSVNKEPATVTTSIKEATIAPQMVDVVVEEPTVASPTAEGAAPHVQELQPGDEPLNQGLTIVPSIEEVPTEESRPETDQQEDGNGNYEQGDDSQQSNQDNQVDQDTRLDESQPASNMNNMQMGMSDTGFGAFNGMMGKYTHLVGSSGLTPTTGMPNMAMGMPNMFGGFGGMGMGNMNAMNMSMMNGYGWNGQQNFAGNFGYFPNDGYNQPFGNGMRQFPNQGNFNRFQGQASFRGRGRGFRGRGRFNQNFQGYGHNYQGYDQNQQGYYEQDHGGGHGQAQDRNQQDWNGTGEDADTGGRTAGDERDEAAHESMDQNGVPFHGAGEAMEVPERAPGSVQGDSGLTGAVAEIQGPNGQGPFAQERQSSRDYTPLKAPSPPINAPTGPKAMREPYGAKPSKPHTFGDQRRSSITRSAHGSALASESRQTEQPSRDNSRTRRSRRDRSRSPRVNDDDEYDRHRERSKRPEGGDDKDADARHRSSRGRRRDKERPSRSRSPASDKERRDESRHRRDKDRSSRSHRDGRHSDRSKYEGKERSSNKHDERSERRAGRDSDRGDRRRHERDDDDDDDSSYSRRKHRDHEERPSKHHRRSHRDDNDHEDSSRRHSKGDRDRDRDREAVVHGRDSKTSRRKDRDPTHDEKRQGRDAQHRSRRESAADDDLAARIEANRRARQSNGQDEAKGGNGASMGDEIGFKIRGRGTVDTTAAASGRVKDAGEVPSAPRKGRDRLLTDTARGDDSSRDKGRSEAAAQSDPYAAEREARQRERMAKEMKRRESATLGKRSRDDFDPPTGPRGDGRKRGRASNDADRGDERERR